MAVNERKVARDENEERIVGSRGEDLCGGKSKVPRSWKGWC